MELMRQILGVVGYVLLFAVLLIPSGVPLWPWAWVLPMSILALRIHFEERLLRTVLPDYAAYARRVRWRPGPKVSSQRRPESRRSC